MQSDKLNILKEIKKNINPSSILIVDDNVQNLQVLGGFLQKEGLLVEFALNGVSALNWVARKKFDLILLDVTMPGMDGFEVCSRIKETTDNGEIPIIFITAKTDSDSIIKGFDAGAVDYIAKPFIQSELLVRIETQINIKKSKEQIIHYLHEIETRNRDISDSIEYARYIQNAIISKSQKNLKYLPEHFILHLPKATLSGDFYWLHKIGKKLIIAVMDCTGHGVPGAFMSILGITLLNEIILQNNIIRPDEILESLRSKIMQTLGQKKGYGNIKDGIEGSVICYDPESRKIQYSGSFNPMVLIHDGTISEIKADRIPIGYYEVIGNFNLHETYIEKGDTIYLFSDGFVDQFGGPDNRRFMIRHLKEHLLANHLKPMIMQHEILITELNYWQGDAIQTDDILVLGIRF
jgi:sigma-B regulation protein RsbU (phosphoserine phosphatase)